MRFLFLLAVFVMVFSTIYGYSEEEAWNDYKNYGIKQIPNENFNLKKKYGKFYRIPFDGGNQERIRKALFHIKNAEIIKHNSENSDTFRLELNNFSDMSPLEKARYLGIKADSVPSARFLETIVVDTESRQLPPASLDYRYDSCLPAIKQQGSCGSCWAFTAITPLEFSKCKRSGSPVVLSEQQLLDCDRGNYGCNGGWYTTAWEYIKRANGSAKKSFYPYTAWVGSCKFRTSMVGAKVSSFNYVRSNNATAMQVALQQYGPLAVAMTVVSSFYSYAGGVYSDSACDGLNVNHGVVIVGWGVLNGVNYWIARNSWGTSWGLSGYFLIQRDVNKCSIETYPAFVTAI